MKKLIELFIHKNVFGNILTAAVIVIGVISAFMMQRESFPRADFDVVVVQTAFLGASPQEVEKLVTIPIERELKSIDGVKETGSTSLDNRSAIVLQLEQNLEDKMRVIQDIKDGVDRAKREFSDNISEPLVLEISSRRFPIIEIVLNTKPDSNENITELKLRQLADGLIDKIEQIDDVATVDKRGYREREIQVEVFPDKLFEYNVSVEEITQALSSRNLNMPGGNVIEKGKEYAIRTVMEFNSVEEIQNQIIRLNDYGGALRLKDIATVKDDFEKKKYIEKANAKEAIILTVLKNENGDAIDLVDSVFEKIEEFKKEGPQNLEISTMNDMSFFIKRRLTVLQGNILLGIIMVLISLFFFLGWRVSIMVAIGIPFSFAATLMVMNYLGISINLISMFGLIIVSGMIVDDAIVVGENVYRHIERGEKPLKAAIIGSSEMVAPVTAAIATTIIAFMPMMFMGGMMGKFVWVLPAAIIIALLASLFESFFILPSHIVDITKNSPKDKILKDKDSFEYKFFKKLQNKYRKTLEWSLNYRYLVVISIFFIFLGSVLLVKETGFILFPKGGVEAFHLKVEGPQGISLDEMNKRIAPIEKAVLDLPATKPDNELENMALRVGIHQERPNDPFTKRGNNYAQINVYLTPETERRRKAAEIIAYLKGKIDYEVPILYTGKTSDNKILELTNRPEAKLFSAENLSKPENIIPINNDFLIGGGLLDDKNTLIVYTGKNDLITIDLNKSKITDNKIIELKRYDSPVKFVFDSKTNNGILVTELGFLYQINVKSGTYKEIEKYKTNITSINLLPENRGFFLTTDNGYLEIFKFENGYKKETSIHESPAIKGKGESMNIDFTSKMSLSRIEYAALSNDQNHIYICGFDGFIYKYNLNSNKIIEVYAINSNSIFWVKQDPQNLDILWISQNKKFFSYNTKEKKIKKEFEIEGNIQTYISSDNATDWYALGSRKSIVKIKSGLKESVSIIQKGETYLEKIEFKQAHGGPPVGLPVSIEIRGDEFDTLREISQIVKEKLRAIDGVYDIRDNWEEGKEEFHVQINEEIAALAGVSVMQIASTVQAAFEGRVATSIKRAEEEIDIRVMFSEDLREKLSSLRDVKIRNRMGNLVPITELASFKKYPGVSLITHVDNKRTIYVKANIDERRNESVKVNTDLMDMMTPVMIKYPGYNLVTGGEMMDTKESMENLGRAAIFAIAGIGIILVLLFGNLRHFRVIMSAIPLGFIGVSVAFFLHKKLHIMPDLVFGFIATMGIVGLTGVVVNDSIVFVDFINKLRKAGLNRHDAIVGAGLHRLRPVILTTVTTVVGLLPTAYGLGGDDPFLKPMALAMAWGLFFATIITLIIVPSLYAIWEDRGFIFHNAVLGSIKKKRKGKKDAIR
ncbi:MAG: efflux RND transporter permease subunit [Spirochaetia bacterium]|nr:efflux RND transporter permease subunit [Spirochaetia bacterium]